MRLVHHDQLCLAIQQALLSSVQTEQVRGQEILIAEDHAGCKLQLLTKLIVLTGAPVITEYAFPAAEPNDVDLLPDAAWDRIGE